MHPDPALPAAPLRRRAPPRRYLLPFFVAAGALLGAAHGSAAGEKPAVVEKSLVEQLQEMVDADQNQQALALGEAKLETAKPGKELFYLLTQASYGADDYERTRQYALKTLEFDPGHEWAARFYLIASRSLEKYEDGLAFGRQWVEKNKNGSDVYKDLALLAHDAGRVKEATELAAEAFKRKPGSPRIAGVHFYFQCINGDAKAGAAAAQEWAAKNKPDTFFWAQLGKGLSDAEKFSDAMPFLQRALAEGSEDHGVADEIMDCYRGLNDRAGAAKFLETYGATHEPRAYLWRTMGAMHFDAEAYGEALTAFQKSKKLDPENPSTMANLIFTLVELKRAREGIEEGQRWLDLELDTATPGLHRAIGNAYFARDRWREAEPHYRAALELDPTRMQDARELVVTLTKLNRAPEAVRLGQEWRGRHAGIPDDGFEDALAAARKAAAGGAGGEAKGQP